MSICLCLGLHVSRGANHLSIIPLLAFFFSFFFFFFFSEASFYYVSYVTRGLCLHGFPTLFQLYKRRKNALGYLCHLLYLHTSLMLLDLCLRGFCLNVAGI
ncbi:hypothetical protein QBC32DRAFT_333450 [Pseudoneurospora amorphoporcata]|uniref:Uncharacterized protein n=1 Tax=Pseudoneurospora amorphoporcata TaxID=241081 RepID=A0AAN6P0D4_9PEZI|nr:hypothetical protein QBC32DRAFT_333450 [Pseudoneurospora amorphoporcata]